MYNGYDWYGRTLEVREVRVYCYSLTEAIISSNPYNRTAMLASLALEAAAARVVLHVVWAAVWVAVAVTVAVVWVALTGETLVTISMLPMRVLMVLLAAVEAEAVMVVVVVALEVLPLQVLRLTAVASTGPESESTPLASPVSKSWSEMYVPLLYH